MPFSSRGPRPPFRVVLGLCALLAAAGAIAQNNPSAPQPFVEELRQQERERALRDQQERAVDARLPREAKPAIARLPENEAPCFRIDRLTLDGERVDAFQWLLSSRVAAGESGDDGPIGRCLGTQGVDTVLARLQQALVEAGWVTTRVLAAPQDLAGGTLAFTLVPGRIAALRTAEGNIATTELRNAIPAMPGDLLNLRDIEQGLENLKRLPTADADIQIEPSKAADARPGDSDLVVKYSRASRALGPLRATLSLDDSGTKSTGRTQGGATVAWDGPLGLNDLAYVSVNHDLFNHSGQGTSGQTLHYSIPFGYWLLGTTLSRSKYHQSVAGLSQDYVYAGESRNAEVRLSRLMYRDQQRKTTVSLRAFRRASNNFIDDTEIEVQRRVVGGWELGLNHREFIGSATLDANLQYRRGTGAFGSIEAPEALFGEGTARFGLIAADANLTVPFQLGEQKLRYSGLWRAQWNRTALTPQDRLAIGGRYTVRGFDGETSLMAERGWLLRNDIGWALGASGVELYLGIDHGQVGGASARYLLGHRLTGGVLGVRGALQGLSYDLFIGAPIKKPDGYRTAKTTVGFNLNFNF
ncbi:ShlB/FhaC/HecB family hemolysin secretion/activation protein [Variovorax ginsengisoli]|uniref:ShlB/FhaC/HecB family hemolysin secretion/activation protein n=1 Tax=Variovorax guangxiensis TaxID=1775474 RepID=A0A502DW21_9BURK|nr:ShlB/FhaC/HecB family hemolysin secretion/activation protein [Variovorax ginsengisoli]TPG29274.1 ShlB/FhaC/HecB family hemolysin secretion/activation protein [Variovorax guangxiensis]